jgi:hypothetical protein
MYLAAVILTGQLDLQSFTVKISTFSFLYGIICFWVMSVGNFRQSKYQKDYSIPGVLLIFAVAVLAVATNRGIMNNIFFTVNFFLPPMVLLLLFAVSFMAYKSTTAPSHS